ncbi:Natural killer cells antigen CD94, partial [Galemys pyrenaicus]
FSKLFVEVDFWDSRSNVPFIDGYFGNCVAKRSCQEGWVGYRCNCYFISSESRSWHESRAVCVSMNSSLLQMHSRDELAQLYEIQWNILLDWRQLQCRTRSLGMGGWLCYPSGSNFVMQLSKLQCEIRKEKLFISLFYNNKQLKWTWLDGTDFTLSDFSDHSVEVDFWNIRNRMPFIDGYFGNCTLATAPAKKDGWAIDATVTSSPVKGELGKKVGISVLLRIPLYFICTTEKNWQAFLAKVGGTYHQMRVMTDAACVCRWKQSVMRSVNPVDAHRRSSSSSFMENRCSDFGDHLPGASSVCWSFSHKVNIPTCPSDWYQHGVNCYLLSRIKNTWDKCLGYCTGLNANFLKLDTEEEMTFVMKLSKMHCENLQTKFFLSLYYNSTQLKLVIPAHENADNKCIHVKYGKINAEDC